jgi:hypothetical protein
MILEAVSEMSHERRCGILKMLHPQEAASALSMMSPNDAQQALEDIRTHHGIDQKMDAARRDAERELDLAVYTAESALKAGEELSAGGQHVGGGTATTGDAADDAETQRVSFIEVLME